MDKRPQDAETGREENAGQVGIETKAIGEEPLLKNPRSLKWLGGILLLTGSLTAGTALVSAFSGAGEIDQARLLAAVQLSQARALLEQRGAPTKPIDNIQEQLDRSLADLGLLLKSPSIRIGYAVQVLLGLGAAISGVGMLKCRPWLAAWVTALAALNVVFFGWWSLASPLVAYRRGMADVLLQLLSRAVVMATQTQLERTIRVSELVVEWGGWLSVVLWSGFLCWYVRRPGVKSACGAI